MAINRKWLFAGVGLVLLVVVVGVIMYMRKDHQDDKKDEVQQKSAVSLIAPQPQPQLPQVPEKTPGAVNPILMQEAYDFYNRNPECTDNVAPCENGMTVMTNSVNLHYSQ